MSHTIVLGGGLCGLSAAMMLARDGHRVTVLERDPAPVPADAEAAWERWQRDGVMQFRQAHYLQPLGRAVLERELPDVLDAFKAAGAYRFDPIADAMPRRSPTVRRATVTSASSPTPRGAARSSGWSRAPRRPSRASRSAAASTSPPSRRAAPTGACTSPPCAPTRASGSPASSIIDAMGRGSALPKLLAAAGGDRRPRGGRGHRLPLLHALLPRRRRQAPRPDQRTGRHVLDPHAARATTAPGASRSTPPPATGR